MLPAPIIEGTIPAFYAIEVITGSAQGPDGVSYPVTTKKASITVPFEMSKAVSKNEIGGFKLKIKNITGSDHIMVATYSFNSNDANDTVYLNKKVPFDISKGINKLKVGCFYKVQLAYIDRFGDTGYYSTVGIVKYTTKPEVTLVNLISNSDGYISQYEYNGCYSQIDGDATEKVYSYRFVLSDENNQVIEDTGYLIHNRENDHFIYQSEDKFQMTYSFAPGSKYNIQYFVKTNNGLEEASKLYTISVLEGYSINLVGKLKAECNNENGYINLSFSRTNADEISGDYFIFRTLSGESNWKQIQTFSLDNDKNRTFNWKDFTVEQGKSYVYAIQQYIEGQGFSEKLTTLPVLSSFDCSYLYDGERQLKIKFNPKVGSFKETILEAKMDTLGSPYPFIFRNGNVRYKEFSVSGLISYLSDEEGLFMKENNPLFAAKEREYERIYTLAETTIGTNPEKFYKNLYHLYKIDGNNYIKLTTYLTQIGWSYFNKGNYYNEETKTWNWPSAEFRNHIFNLASNQIYTRYDKEINRFNPEETVLKSTNLTDENIKLEREFKLEVLNWLNNGKPKLFRSATEGNYLVRLMNVSLAPNDQLGRMLHTFNATAYEIADTSYESLIKYHIIPGGE